MIHIIFTGGTLGLFLGMSLMTVVEILIWLIKLLFKIMTLPTMLRKKKKRLTKNPGLSWFN